MFNIWGAERTWLLNYLNTRAIHSVGFRDKSADDLKSIFDSESEEKNLDKILRIEGDTASIRIQGYLNNDGPDWWDRLFGWGEISYQQIIAAIDKIQTDNMIKNVRLKMNTPGGMFEGVDNVWKSLMSLRKDKHIVAINEALLASSGYYIASAAHEIHSTSETNESGSIGVMVAGTDWTKYDEKHGIKEVVIVSKNAPDKHVDIGTKKGQNILQERVDIAEQFFLDRISAGRGVSVDDIKANFGRGGLLYSKTPNAGQPDALSAGMIDKIIDVSKETGDNSSPVSITSAQENFMTLAEFLAANPNVKADYDRQLEAKGQAEFKRGEQAGRDATVATAERVFIFMKADSPYAQNPQIQEAAIAVLKQKEPESNLTNLVRMFDMNAEKDKSDKGKTETKTTPETPGDHTPPAKPGVVNDEESMNAAVKEAQGMC